MTDSRLQKPKIITGRGHLGNRTVMIIFQHLPHKSKSQSLIINKIFQIRNGFKKWFS